MRRPLFDAAYYAKYYERNTAVITRKEAEAEVAFVLAFCHHIRLDIRSFADVGAGTGWWAREFKRQHPKCRQIETFDSSEAAALKYGHARVSADKIAGKPADLVVCRDVLRYLDGPTAKVAIKLLAKKCRGVLYFHVVTSDDDVDEKASDMTGYFRSARWYLRQLTASGFRNAGMGLFVSSKFRGFDPFKMEVPDSVLRPKS